MYTMRLIDKLSRYNKRILSLRSSICWFNRFVQIQKIGNFILLKQFRKTLSKFLTRMGHYRHDNLLIYQKCARHNDLTRATNVCDKNWCTKNFSFDCIALSRYLTKIACRFILLSVALTKSVTFVIIENL